MATHRRPAKLGHFVSPDFKSPREDSKYLGGSIITLPPLPVKKNKKED